jgi:transcriptional regulator with XRE-family HTH domain
MALGKTLQDARTRKKMTASQVAAATRMKVQTVEAIEREDFSRITAPVYGKGFLKLYAECVEIDPAPLIAEYVERFAPAKTPSLKGDAPPPRRIAEEPVFGPDEIPSQPQQPQQPPAPAKAQAAKPPEPEPDLFTRAARPVPSADVLPRPAEEKKPQADLWTAPAQAASGRAWEPDTAGSSPVSEGHSSFESRSVVSFIKYASIVVGVIVILIFLGSGISRWTKKSEAQQPSTPQKLHVAINPPAPYVD